MRFLSSLLAGAAALSSLASAQSLAFTSGFSDVSVGKSTQITYSAPDLTVPVTITLRKGNPLNLDTVGVLTSIATGGSYSWTPDSSLTSATDYALQITQGDQINYSGQFNVEGGAASYASSSSTASITGSSTASSPSASTTSATSVNITSSLLSLSSSIASALNSSATSVISSAHNSSAHNSTASLSTLTTTTSSGIATAATTTGGATRTGSSTSSSSSSAPTSGANGLKSPIALIFGAVAAMAYLQ